VIGSARLHYVLRSSPVSAYFLVPVTPNLHSTLRREPRLPLLLVSLMADASPPSMAPLLPGARLALAG
jgi:hypothetical protein